MELMNFLIYLVTMMSIYGILALGLNFHYGHAGLVNFGHVAFFCVGAYASTLVTMAGAPFLVGLLAALISGALLGFLISLPTSKLSVHYWAICTLGAGEIIRLITLNEEWLTQGAFGIPGISQPLKSIIPAAIYPVFYLILVFIFLGIVYLLTELLVRSPFGRVLKAIREEDDLPLAMGKNVFRFRVKALSIGAAFAGLAGGLYAHYITYISPLDFMPIVTFLVWAMVIIGGKGNNLGSLVGTMVIVIFYNSTRFLKDYIPISANTLASLRMVVIGILMILVLLFMNQGLVREKKRVYRIPGEKPDAGS